MKEYTEKELRILDVASQMFAEKPFHKVLLSEVARVASVGKGTLYLYFSSKEDLYFAVLFREFALLVDNLGLYTGDEKLRPDQQMTCIVKELAIHMARSSANVTLVGRVLSCPCDTKWQEKKKELWGIIESVILKGIKQGIFKDQNPKLTAIFIAGLIRSGCIFKTKDVTLEELCEHASKFVLNALETSCQNDKTDLST